ncbi:MAG: efflux RND transporter periplasmic adaptor subunit [Planctomycetota bacterium]|jgi:RND family efflux transporter MFP subunit
MEYIKKIIFLIVVIAILGVAYMFFRKSMGAPPPQMPPAMPVQVADTVIQDFVRYDEFTGRIGSVESVDIRARISGYLMKAAFKDGAFVQKGDLLFEIESDSYQADRDKAVADLKSAQAHLNRAQLDYDRIVKAAKSEAVSKQDVSKYLAERDMAEAIVIRSQAALAQAELNLSYTKIYSPIDGKISERFVDVGNLVGAGEMTLLAQVVSLDPIYVYFNVSEGDLLNYYENTSDIVSPGYGLVKFQVDLANKSEFPIEGVLDYMDNTVDATTGTIQVRGILNNPARKILPGMFARVKVPAGQTADAVLIQEKAIGTDLGGKYVLVIGEGNLVEHREIQISDLVDGLRVVDRGLSAGETYIISGIQFVRPGMEVIPVPQGQMPPMGGAGESGPKEQVSEDSEPKAATQ